MTLLQVADDECGAVLANEMDIEPYFVDFLRDAPEATGVKLLSISDRFAPVTLSILLFS